MNSKKLWTAFVVIFLYLSLTALVSVGGATLSTKLDWKWGVPFAIGGVFWVLSLVFFLCREKAFLFAPLSLLANAIGAGFFIGAFLVGEKISVSWTALLTVNAFITATYFLLMLLLSLPTLKRKIWYVIVAFVLAITGSVLLSAYLLPSILEGAGMRLPPQRGTILFFFLLLYGMLALGSVTPVDDFEELLTALILPALVSTFFLAFIVLLCLAGCDDCSCDGCESCCDCGDCSGGQYNSTSYGKRRKTTMSQMSNIPPVEM